MSVNGNGFSIRYNDFAKQRTTVEIKTPTTDPLTGQVIETSQKKENVTLYDLIDTNGNGRLSQKELKEANGSLDPKDGKTSVLEQAAANLGVDTMGLKSFLTELDTNFDKIRGLNTFRARNGEIGQNPNDTEIRLRDLGRLVNQGGTETGAEGVVDSSSFTFSAVDIAWAKTAESNPKS